jgi:hypothetical protein
MSDFTAIDPGFHDWLKSHGIQDPFMVWYRANSGRFEPQKGRSGSITTTLYIQKARAAYDREVLGMSRREWRKKWHHSKFSR